ncbi:MAG: exosortase/archaeosortase family protein [Lentisphaerae bacterium]|nr:exosortase/archaeosortase family protein [Lentisphaerota bacterium]
MKIFFHRFMKHPLGVLYGALLGVIAFFAALPMLKSGMWDAALVDLAMAVVLIALMLKPFAVTLQRKSNWQTKLLAYLLLAGADILALLPTHDFPGSLSTALAFTLLICALVMYFSGAFMAASCMAPALWCCVFMPYHEEFMLLLSYPLRLSATMLSGITLNLLGVKVVHVGTSLSLPNLSIAITDACSGINQLDAFILIAFIAVQMLHKKRLWKLLHLAFIIPAIILGNTLRIVLTVLLYMLFGETVLENTWHVVLGYGQIIFALVIFGAVGKIFCSASKKSGEAEL